MAQLVEYILYDKGRAKGKHAFILTQNLKGNSAKDWIRQLKNNEPPKGRLRKNATRVIHEIISFHVKDSNRITAAILEDIAREYMRFRSPNGIFVAVPHIEDAHLHIHIAGSPWEYRSTKSLRMSHKEFKELKLSIQGYQQTRYPELTHSLVDHGKQRKDRLPDTQSIPISKDTKGNLVKENNSSRNEIEEMFSHRIYKNYSRGRF